MPQKVQYAVNIYIVQSGYLKVSENEHKRMERDLNPLWGDLPV